MQMRTGLLGGIQPGGDKAPRFLYSGLPTKKIEGHFKEWRTVWGVENWYLPDEVEAAKGTRKEGGSLNVWPG